MTKEQVNYLTTLSEKEMFAQNFMGSNVPIKLIYYFLGTIIILDMDNNYIVSSSQKLMRYCNESLLVAKKTTYHSIEEFMNEYQNQRVITDLNSVEEAIPKDIILRIKEYYLSKMLKKEYPEMEDFIISGEEVAIFIPNQKNQGKTILQYYIDDSLPQKIKRK